MIYLRVAWGFNMNWLHLIILMRFLSSGQRLNKELIKNDKDNKSTQYKPINPQDEEISQSDPTEIEKDILVNRPQKNFVWGLGNQTKQKKCILIFINFFS